MKDKLKKVDIKGLIDLLKKSIPLYKLMKKKITSNIRLELVGTFTICIFISILFFFVSIGFIGIFQIHPYMNYSDGINNMQWKTESLVSKLSKQEYSIQDKENIKKIIDDYAENHVKILITDLDGKVNYKTKNGDEIQVDLYNVIKNVNENRYEDSKTWRGREPIQEQVFIYPINFKDQRSYLILKGIPDGEIKYFYDDIDVIVPVMIVISVMLLLYLVFILTKRKVQYIQEISEGLIEISKGNLDFRIVKKGEDELGLLAQNINHMSESLEKKIEEERRAEATKNELITNVSHDLRTPLTSIIGYLGLIKEKRYKDEQDLEEYTRIAFHKSEKLKILIDDLFEYTKVANKGIELNKIYVNLNEFLDQLIEEFVPIFEENNLELEKEIVEEKLNILIDPDKTVRVFENLLMNAVKYSFKPGKIKISIYKDDYHGVVCIENKGKTIPKDEISYLFERFYKGDKSRTSEDEGTGLGLAIAKSIVEIQGGNIWATCEEENIRFFVSFKC
ncbi:sensor histidine kinase [Crassaminicella profunda]|uniref:sensor histidine kinase n=1 Tax=Crassaminicella profunda TaxID=1286698 RepID=UPI001CA611E3|nr:HAMP domain-containing sensor histidine kinase [Crassaminicella profunda]QZY53855.1 HAMP domain-containing histidine kinase [Crassaminicella profunda]